MQRCDSLLCDPLKGERTARKGEDPEPPLHVSPRPEHYAGCAKDRYRHREDVPRPVGGETDAAPAPTASERKTGVKRAEVITARLVQDERGWLRIASGSVACDALSDHLDAAATQAAVGSYALLRSRRASAVATVASSAAPPPPTTTPMRIRNGMA